MTETDADGPDGPDGARRGVAGAAGDGCDPASSKARLDATFSRTVDCAADAASAGLADKVRLAGQSVKDTKKIVDVIKGFAGKVGVTNISSARAILCVRSVSGYTTKAAAKAAIKGAAVGLTDAEIDTLWAQLESSFSLGVSSVFDKLAAVEADPTMENLVGFLTAFASNISSMGGFITTCGSVLADFGTLALPSIASYAARFSQLGVVSSIAKCGFAVVGNALDVGKELSCLAADFEHIRQQYATLQRMNDSRCETFQSFAQDPALLPILNSSSDSDARRSACYQVIHHWGSCVYDAHRSGVFGSTRLTCAECERVCTGYTNSAGPNAYLQPVIDGALSSTDANPSTVRRLVQDAALNCGTDVQPDGLQPCINFCRGQVADCP